MFYGNPLGLILEWKIPNLTDWNNLIAYFEAKYARIFGNVTEMFGSQGNYIIAMFFAFIGLIIIIHVMSIINEFRQDDKTLAENETTDSATLSGQHEYIQFSQEELSPEDVAELQAQIEEEKEISRNLIAASETSDDFLHISEDYARLKDIMQRHAGKKSGNIQNQTITEQLQVSLHILSPQEREVHQKVAPIIKLLGRQVSEYKTAQAVFNRANPPRDEEDVLQLVRSICDFIGLARHNIFANLPNGRQLPHPAAALSALAEKGDNSLCLELLKFLAKQYIDDAEAATGLNQKLYFAQAANYACMAGNFALLDDLDLALSSYHFATEIAPENVNAWSRLGDAYLRQGHSEKAMFAFQSVLELGDYMMHSQQIANAKRRLATYYKQQGIEKQAQIYQEDSDRYYLQNGLREPLSEVEDAAYDIVMSRQDIPASLEVLLQPAVSNKAL